MRPHGIWPYWPVRPHPPASLLLTHKAVWSTASFPSRPSSLIASQDVCTGCFLCPQISAGLSLFCHWGISSKDPTSEGPTWTLSYNRSLTPISLPVPLPNHFKTNLLLYAIWVTILCFTFAVISPAPQAVLGTEWNPINIYWWNNWVISLTPLKNTV